MKTYDGIVVGLGNIGARFRNPKTDHPFNHSEALLGHGRVKLVGGADPSAENRKYFESNYNLPAHASLEELLELRPALASICSPSSEHYKQVMLCLEADVKMIWLEKPPVETPAELQQIYVKAQECGAKVLVNYQRRYCDNYRAVRDLFSDGRLGSPIAAQITYSRGLETNGSHMLDVLFFITSDMGDILLDSASTQCGEENPSFAFSTNGFPVSVVGLNLPYHCVEVIVYMEKGRATVRFSGMDSLVDVVVENEYAPGYYRLSDGRDVLKLPPANMTCMFPAIAIDDLVGAYEEGREPLSSLATAAQTQQLNYLVRARLK